MTRFWWFCGFDPLKVYWPNMVILFWSVVPTKTQIRQYAFCKLQFCIWQGLIESLFSYILISHAKNAVFDNSSAIHFYRMFIGFQICRKNTLWSLEDANEGQGHDESIQCKNVYEMVRNGTVLHNSSSFQVH